MIRGRSWTLGLLVCVCGASPLPQAAEPAGPSPAAETSLTYRAYVAGVPVGTASVEVTVSDSGYRVSGEAVSNGWLTGFTKWRNRFAAHGRLDGRDRQPQSFTYLEEDRDKTRDVVIRDGTLRVTKNGRTRPERPAPPYPDIISGLFARPYCRDDHVLSTGRHVYRLQRLTDGVTACRYAVTDDDEDTFEIELALGQRGGLVVPTRIAVTAWLSGWIELEELPPAAPAPPPAVTAEE